MLIKIFGGLVFIVLLQVFLTPFLVALNPVYVPIFESVPFGGAIIFIVNNIGFFIFLGFVVWVWKSLQKQDALINYSNYRDGSRG